MTRILVPVNGSTPSRHALQHVIGRACQEPGTEVHLLHVQTPMPAGIHAYYAVQEIQALEAEESAKVLEPACAMLTAAHVRYLAVRRTGAIAQAIAKYAEDAKCDQIIIGTHHIPLLGSFAAAPSAAKVIHLSRVPVTLVK